MPWLLSTNWHEWVHVQVHGYAAFYYCCHIFDPYSLWTCQSVHVWCQVSRQIWHLISNYSLRILHRYYCQECHKDEEVLIPARIIHNWDFNKHAGEYDNPTVFNIYCTWHVPMYMQAYVVHWSDCTVFNCSLRMSPQDYFTLPYYLTMMACWYKWDFPETPVPLLVNIRAGR